MSGDPIIKHLRDVLDYKWSGTGLVPSEVRSILDALAAKDTALSEMRAELEEYRSDYLAEVRTAQFALERATAAEAELERARKALQPFAKVFECDIGEDEADADRFQPMRTPYNRAPLLTVGDFRAAARALAPSIQDEGGER